MVPRSTATCSLFALLCFALGLEGWAGPILRSVEPHPTILTCSLSLSLALALCVCARLTMNFHVHVQSCMRKIVCINVYMYVCMYVRGFVYLFVGLCMHVSTCNDVLCTFESRVVFDKTCLYHVPSHRDSYCGGGLVARLDVHPEIRNNFLRCP